MSAEARSLTQRQGTYSSAGGAPGDEGNPAGGWFGPGKPILPTAPPDVAGRAWDFTPGINFQINPRPYEAVQYWELRALADSLDMLRLVIETRKDQMAKLNWTITPKLNDDGTPMTDPDSPVAKQITRFYARPDGEHDWATWQRMLLEDVFVIDAPTLYCKRTKGGKLLALEQIDGSGIKRIFDDWGRTPAPPIPAYQHILHGMPAVEYTTDDLIWKPRNPRIHKAFGYGPVEQIIITVRTAILKQLYLIDFFTAGNMPEAIIGTPPEWTLENIKSFQAWWDGLMAGNLENRRRAYFVPGGVSNTYHATKNPELTGKTEEWLARVICYAFSISPQSFVSMMNRACYSSDTETLTDRGWKLFKNIRPTDKIATVNPDSGMMEFHFPTGRYAYPYTGEMIRFHTSCSDALVTPEHKMWMRTGPGAQYRKVQAKDAPASQFYFQAAVEYSGGQDRKEYELSQSGRSAARSINADDWIELVGYFASEGGLSTTKYHYLFTLAQKAGPKADRIQDVLDRLGISCSKYPTLDKGVQRWNVYGKQVCDWMRENVGERCHTKRLPREMLNLCSRQLRILFDALMLGDGTVDSRENRTARAYHSTSKGLADDVQELAIKLGYSARVTTHYKAHGNRREAYRVLICDRKEYSIQNRTHENWPPPSVTREVYDGYVYCFEVPNHLFVTRRNGCVGIHGNTAQTSKEAALEEGLYPLMQWMKSLVDETIDRFWPDHIDDDGRPASSLEFKWNDDAQIDKTEQQQVFTGYAKTGIMTINEVRDGLGLDPIPGGETARVMTATGYVLVDVNDDAPTAGQAAQQKLESSKAQPAALAANKPTAGAAVTPPTSAEPAKGEAPATKLAKTFRKPDHRTITHQSYWTKNKTHRHEPPDPGGTTSGEDTHT